MNYRTRRSRRGCISDDESRGTMVNELEIYDGD